MNSKSNLRSIVNSLSTSLLLVIAVCALDARGQSNCAPAGLDLVGWWKGDGSAADSAGTNTGVLGGGMGFAPGLVSQAFSFTGSSYMVVPASSATDIGKGTGITIESWFKAADSIGRPFVEWSPNGTYGAHVYVNHPTAGNVYVNLYDTQGQHHIFGTTSSVLVPGTFNHLAVTYDKASGIGRIIVNGVTVSASPLGSFTPQTSYDMCLGYRLPGAPFGVDYFKGLIDEFSIYSRGLSTNEISAIYAAGSAGKCPVGPASPPVIITQPINQSVLAGSNVEFSVTATGTAPISYQWRFNGTDLSGKTSSILSLGGIQASNAGTYSVLVANAAGSVLSSNAVLSVILPPDCTPPPAGLVSWWRAEGAPIDAGGSNNAVLGGGLVYGSGKVGQAFAFTGTNGFVRVPASTSLNVGLGGGFTLEAWIQPAQKATLPVFDWSSGSGYAVLLYANHPSVGTLYASVGDATGTLHVLQSAGNVLLPNSMQHVALTYDKASGIARLMVDGVIVAQDTVGMVTPKTDTDLGIGFRVPEAPYGAGYYDGLIDEATLYSRALATNELQAIFLSGIAGKCFSVIVPPAISLNPLSQQVDAGANVQFAVAASGTAPLKYQWIFNGSELTGQTNEVLSLINVQGSNSGTYAVRVSNAAGSVLSSTATLSVVLPPDCTPLPAGIVSWWKAEGASIDVLGVNSAVVGGDLGYSLGKVGQAFAYTGTNGYVKVPASTSLNVGLGGGFTLEGWIQPAQKATLPVFDWSSASGYAVLLFANHPSVGTLYASVGDATGTTHLLQSAGNALLPNRMQHVALTYDKASGIARLMVDGAVAAQATIGTITPKTDTALGIGYRVPEAPYGPGFYEGLIDEVSIYSRALGTNELKSIYQSGIAGKCVPAILPPVITSHPASQRVDAGADVQFTVAASGTSPLNYQWLFNGSELTGQTDQILSLTSVQGSNSGIYAVRVSNASGTALSANATLTVVLPKVCTPTPGGIVAWWRGEGNVEDPIGGNTTDLGGGLAFAAGKVGQAFSFNGTNAFITIPAAPSMDVGKSNGMTIEAWIKPGDVSQRPLFEWSPNGTYGVHVYLNRPSVGAVYVNLVDTQGGNHAFSTTSGVVQSGAYNHFALTYDKASGVARLVINGSVVAQPSIGSFSPQTSFALNIGYRLPGAPFGVSFFKGQIDEVSLYSRALAVDEIKAIYAADTLGKCVQIQSPVVVTQPADQTVMAGQTATFKVWAGGTGPLAYQWSLNGGSIEGATGASLVLTNIQMGSAGSYAVTVTNLLGSVTSSNAVLTVTLPPTSIRVPNTAAAGGGVVVIPVLMTANGNENAMGFSLNFSTNVLRYTEVGLGSNAQNAALLVNTNQLAAGRLGLALSLPSDNTFSPGQVECLNVIFTSVLNTNQTTSTISFGDQPTQRQLSDAKANSLSATYTGGTLTIAAAELEADVAPRPGGDHSVSITDWVQVGRYVARLDFPTNGTEFQRADCAPRDTSGNGVLSVADWVQSGRYAAGLDPVVVLGGPSEPSAVPPGGLGLYNGPMKKDLSRRIFVESVRLVQGQGVSVGVYLESQGDENAVGFSVGFDPAQLTLTGAAMGLGTTGALYNLNTLNSAAGRVALVVARPAGLSFSAGAQQILKLNFAPINPGPGAYTVSLIDQPVPREVTDANAGTLSTQFVAGTITISPPPALSATRTPEGLVISWPDWATSVALYETVGDSLSGASWKPVSEPVVVVNGARTVTIPLSGTFKCYRLQ